MNFVLSAITAFILAFNSSWNTGVHNVVNFALGNHRNISSNSLTREPVNSDPNVLGASTSTPDSNDNVTFNLDAIFNKNLTAKQGITIQGDSIFNTLKANSINLGNGTITAANILYGVKSGTGISIGDGQSPTITNTGVTSLGGSTGSLSLAAGTGISVSGLTITNSDLGSSQYIFKNFAVSGQNTIAAGSNSDTLTFVAGTGVALTTDSTNKKLTISSNNPNIAAGWTNIGSNVYLTTSSDYVGIGTSSPTSALNVVGTSTLSGPVTLGSSASDALTFMGRIANGTSLLPNTDLGSDLGASDKRFNNLWVANINSNSSQSFSGQTTFSYPPTDTTIAQASVLINPTTSAANGQLLGLALAGYQKALIDAEGDIILGYSGATSAPATNYPLTIYGHNATNVAYVDTSGNLGLTGNNATSTIYGPSGGRNQPYIQFSSVGNGGFINVFGNNDSYMNTNNGGGLNVYGGLNLSTNGGSQNNGNINFRVAGSSSTVNMIINSSGLVGIGTTAPAAGLDVETGNGGNAAMIVNNPLGGDIFTASASGSTKFTIANNGNVGIGTNNPSQALTVNGAINTLGQGNITGGNITANNYYVLVGSGRSNSITLSSQTAPTNATIVSNYGGLEIDTTQNGNINLMPNGTGNVGIGTTSPGAKLSIFTIPDTQTTYANGFPNGLAVTAANNSTNLYGSTFYGTSTYSSGNAGSGIAFGGYYTSTWFTDFAGITGKKSNTANGDNAGDLLLWTTPASQGKTERLRITSSGLVGIGTTAPAAGLDVETGNGGNAAMIVNNPLGGDIFTASASGSTKFTIANNGNVGIGTSNPTNQVHISGAPSSGYNLYVQSTWGGSNIPIADFVADSNVPLSIWKDYTKFYGNTLYVGGSTNSGLVGIGTTNPGALLQISNTGAVGQIGQIIKGVINQSGDLQQWQSSSGLVLTSVSSGGDLLLRKATSTSSNINFYALNGSGSDQLSASLIAGGTGTGFAGGLDSQFIVQLSGSNALSLIESGGGSRNLTASLQPAASSGTLAFQLIANSSQTTATPILQIEDSTNANVMTANHLGDLYLLNNLNTPNGGLGQYANLLIYSQQFDNAAWTKSNVTVTPNSTTSPIGDTTGAYISINSGACQGGNIYQSTATAAGSGTFTASVYIKGTGTAFGVNLKIDNDSGTNQSASTSFNLTSSSSTWQRIQVSKTFSSATGNVRLTLSGGGCGTFPFYAWGSQIEQDTSAGPYVNVAANTVNSNSGMVLNNTLRFSNVATSIVTGTNENFTIIPGGTGNVGIGTTSPNGALDVRASTTRPDSGWGTLSLVSNNAVAADKGGVLDFGGIYNGSGALANWAGIAGLKNDGTDGTYGGYLSFYTRSNSTANIERMRIDMNGNVGIGTTSPSYLLDVNGTARANGLYVNGSGTVGTLGPSGATDGYIYFGQTGRLGTNIYNGGSYYTNTYAHLFQGGNVVISGGLLGIGTTAPLAGLDVEKGNGGNPAMIVNNPLGGDIIDASSSGVMKFSIANHGLVNATSGGLATFTKAGTISDTDFTDTAVNGLIGFDSTDGRLYIRNAGAWSYIAKTAGFQIPSFESAGFAPGDLLQPYVEKIMSDGAVHGLYKKLDINELINSDALTFKTNVEFQGPAVFKALAEFFNNVIFHGNVSFDQAPMMSKNTAGTAIISTYSDHVDVVFDSPYPKTPIVTFNLVNSSTDQTFIADGQQAYLENVTNKGFTIKLPNMAVKDFSYNWMAFATNGDSITKSTSVIQDILGAQATATPSAQPSPTPLRPTGFEGQAPVASATPTTTPTVATATPSATLEITPVASATPTVAP